MLVEAVTGTVPLVADTALGTVGLRQEHAIRVPAELGPVARVADRACRADPGQRYAVADEMRFALAEAAAELPPPGPLVLAGLGAIGEDPHPTQVVATAVERPLFDQDDEGISLFRRPAPAPARSPQRSRSAAPFLLGAVIAVALSALAFVLAQPSRGATTAVPLLIGQQESRAQEIAINAKVPFLITSSERRSDDPAGIVIAQDPEPGGFISEGDTVHLVVSRGPKPVALPELVGLTQAEAVAALQSQFGVDVVEGYNDVVEPGRVISSDPQGSAPLDSLVTLRISKGPRPVAIPDVARELRPGGRQAQGASSQGAARRCLRRHRGGRSRDPDRSAGR